MNIRLKVALIFLAALSLLILSLSASAALLPKSELSALTFKTFAFICHQKASLCFNISGKSMPICSRCFGIYTGIFILSTLLLFFKKDYLLVKKKLFKFKIAIIFFLTAWSAVYIDSRLNSENIIQQSHLRRFITGFAAGCSLAILILFLLNYLFSIIKDQRKP